MDTNITIQVGRLTRDPELSYTSTNNTPLCKISIANNSNFGKEEKDTDVNYFDIVIWNKMAEICSQYLNKGSQICVTGRLNHNRFTDKDGNKRSKVEIIANNIQFLGGKRDGEQYNNSDQSENSGQNATNSGQKPDDNFTNIDQNVPF
jgi:single-strand DNA-binding protein